MIKKFSPVLIFLLGLGFLALSIITVKNTLHKKQGIATDLASSSRSIIIKMRMEAIERAKQKGEKDYSFEVSNNNLIMPYIQSEGR